MFKALTAIVALAASASVMAQSDVTLNSLAHDATTRASFNQMVKGHQLPAWVTTGGTGSPAQTVKLGSESWQVLTSAMPCPSMAKPCCLPPSAAASTTIRTPLTTSNDHRPRQPFPDGGFPD